MNAQKANNTTEKVRELQRKLYLAAKTNGKRKFHALYDKVHSHATLQEAWKRVRANGGSSGIDGVSIKEIEAYGVEQLLTEISEELRAGVYLPKPVKRVNIPKPDGRSRPLGIPTVKDRIVQMAAKMVIEPLFEAWFRDNSWGFRPKRSAHQALDEVRKACNNKGWWVVDADIRNYFDSINHEKLRKLVEVRINDRRILKLIRKWLEAGVMDEGEYIESSTGSPQGGVISPLLANIYLHYLDVLWESKGKHLGKLVRYADDMVVICRTKKQAEHALKLVREILGRLELELHPDKTKLVHMWDGNEGFDFLGMHHRFIPTENSKGEKFSRTHQYPSTKAMQKIKDTVKSILTRRATLVARLEDMIERLNPKLRGWRNYYGLKLAKKWLTQLDWYVLCSFTRWWNKKRQKRKHLADIANIRQMLIKNGVILLAS